MAISDKPAAADDLTAERERRAEQWILERDPWKQLPSDAHKFFAGFAASEVQLAVAQLEHDLEESELRTQTNADALVAIKLRADTAVAEERERCAKVMCWLCADGIPRERLKSNQGIYYWHHKSEKWAENGDCKADAIHDLSVSERGGS